jgi:hypothetical protein
MKEKVEMINETKIEKYVALVVIDFGNLVCIEGIEFRNSIHKSKIYRYSRGAATML